MPDPRLVERIDTWLAEGIDIDADGQYTERSTSVYSPVVNRCFMTLARLLDRPQLYEPVRRNLELTQYLVRPDGELVTEASRRQDQYLRRDAARYWFSYRTMAIRDRDPAFAAMAQFIEQTAGREKLFHELIHVIEDPAALAEPKVVTAVPTNYERSFPGSRLIRIRRGRIDASIVGENTTFFVLHRGAAVLEAVRFASAFFGKGQFAADEFVRSEDGYRLTQHLRGPYFQPLASEKVSGDGVWTAMPHDRREESEVQHLMSQVTVRELQPGQFELDIEIDGTDHVPVAIEMSFRPGGELVGATPLEDSDDTFLADPEGGSYRVGEDAIHFSGGPRDHRWTQLRGAAEKRPGLSVYYTGFTPLKFTLSLS